MMVVEFTFLGVFVTAYTLSKCPWLDGSTTPYAVAIMGILVLVMLAQRLKFCSFGFVPRVDYTKAAIVIAGADYPAGWETTLISESYEMKVYAGVEDPKAPTSEWMRRHFCRFTTLVKMDPRSKEDAEAAARFVAKTIGDAVLVGVVYNGHAVPKRSDTIDMDDVQKEIEKNALAAVNIAKAFAPLLQKHQGRFVFISDTAGRVTIPSLLSYCSTQAVALQYVNIIRTMLEKYKVSTHMVEAMLFNFRKTQESYYHPGSCPDTGKVVLNYEAIHIDNRIILIVRSVLKACLDKKPKERYLTTFEDSFIDFVIRFSPHWVHNNFMSFYLNHVLVKRSA